MGDQGIRKYGSANKPWSLISRFSDPRFPEFRSLIPRFPDSLIPQSPIPHSPIPESYDNVSWPMRDSP